MFEKRVQFVDCPGEGHPDCSGAHVQFESEEQARMVFACRARAARQRQEGDARREASRRTGVWG